LHAAKTFVLALAVLSTVNSTGARAESCVRGDDVQRWIAETATTVRSIDAADEDFADLEPLIEAIGSARVVQLGEPSHGAGSSFAAKVRLSKFLHQRMGFDVLAWESGLYEMRLVQAGLRGSEDPVAAAQQGVFSIWSKSEEVRPLFEYAKATQGTTRPLEMTGFDMQITAANAAWRLAADLRTFVRALHVAQVRERGSRLVEQAIAAHDRINARLLARSSKHAELTKSGNTAAEVVQEAMKAWEASEGAKLQPEDEDLRALVSSIDELLAVIRTHRGSFAKAHGAKEVGFMEHALANMRGNGTNVYNRERLDRREGAAAVAAQSDGWNRRDTLMAENLRWLIEEGYPGRKIIVWGHNAHVMNAHFAADWKSVHAEPQPGGMKPMGAIVSEWLQDDVYTIAFTTHAGQDGWANGQRSGPIAPAPACSLEAKLHALAKPYVFLDFRAARKTPAHPMRTPQSIRVSGYGAPTDPYGNDVVPDPTIAFDAVFYIDEMAPATPIRR
jgi:erythromycin esterase